MCVPVGEHTDIFSLNQVIYLSLCGMQLSIFNNCIET